MTTSTHKARLQGGPCDGRIEELFTDTVDAVKIPCLDGRLAVYRRDWKHPDLALVFIFSGYEPAR